MDMSTYRPSPVKARRWTRVAASHASAAPDAGSEATTVVFESGWLFGLPRSQDTPARFSKWPP